ncbi:hypothetical protein TWF694_000762 [Orbilia ellipsospora]|uniref:CFEM domain-containing protein n=1 Tax=Orbilia ellipsospora TaxID=2528407 RepID=A0AAV9XS65_9PEZI
MYSSSLRLLSLFPFALLEVVALSATGTTATGSLRTGPTSPSVPTTTGTNRITYATLPSCVSSCIGSAVRSIPCKPFIAPCFCALPTGRSTYELPVECVNKNCDQNDISQESSWRESVCAGFTESTTLALSTNAPVTTTSSPSPAGTESCENGWKGCPIGLNGGCCPNDNFCNLLDCQPSPATPTVNITKISSPTQVPPVDISSLFPPCSHQCISQYLLGSTCSISPLNATCFCRLHDLFPCMSSCDSSDTQNFVSAHVEICKPLWYFKPYDPTFERWCDLNEGPGSRGRAFGYDARMGSLEFECPNWWDQRSAGKRFGIVLGIGILSFLFLCGCNGYCKHVSARVRRTEKEKLEARRKIMELDNGN